MCTLFAFITTKIALSRFIMRSLFLSLFISCILTNIAHATPTFGTKLIWQMLMMLIIIIIRHWHFKSQNESTHNKPGSRWRSSRAAVGAVKGAGQHLLVVCWGCHRFGVSGRTLWPMSWLTTAAVTTHTHTHTLLPVSNAGGIKCSGSCSCNRRCSQLLLLLLLPLLLPPRLLLRLHFNLPSVRWANWLSPSVIEFYAVGAALNGTKVAREEAAAGMRLHI